MKSQTPNTEFMDFLLELAKKKNDETVTKQVKDLVNEHKKMIADNDARFQKMVDKQRKLEEERVIELGSINQPLIAPREV